MFTISLSAANKIREAAEQGGMDGLALRLAAQALPDGTIDYRMGFDEKKEDDISIRDSGVEIIMEPEYVPLLNEATLDYVEMAPGTMEFIFINPIDANYTPPSEISPA